MAIDNFFSMKHKYMIDNLKLEISFTSLKLLTKVLGVPSPKDDIDGSEVYRVYYA